MLSFVLHEASFVYTILRESSTQIQNSFKRFKCYLTHFVGLGGE